MGALTQISLYEHEVLDLLDMRKPKIISFLLRKLQNAKNMNRFNDATSSSSTATSSPPAKKYKDQDGKIHHKGGSNKADASVSTEYPIEEALRRSAGNAERQWLKKRNTEE